MKTLWNRLQITGRLNLTGILLLSTLLSLFLVGARVYYTKHITFIFLVWNLFLAWIPFGISSLLKVFPELQSRKFLLGGLLIVWLLFLPNAPYIITDLFHLKKRGDAPFWYDMLLITSFGWNGLMLGLISLMDIQEVIEQKMSVLWSWLTISSIIFLCSLGIYLGRYLRWNSWDVLTNPLTLIQDITERLNPLVHPRILGITMILFAFLFTGYLTLKLITKNSSQRPI